MLQRFLLFLMVLTGLENKRKLLIVKETLKQIIFG